MIDARYKPMWLPQVNAPYFYTLNKLKDQGVDYDCKIMDANDLKPSQGIVALDQISDNLNDADPIWVSDDLKIIDGHHRYATAKTRGLPIKSVVIKLPHRDAARMLNKIQDIFEYENQEKLLDEVVAQDQINMMNEPDSGVSNSEFLATFESESGEVDDEGRVILNDNGKKKKLKGYRNKPINEKSMVGNFFSLNPSEGYDKYDMEFDAILDTDDLDIRYKKDMNPVLMLARIWYPNKDFDAIAKKHGVEPVSIINRVVSEKAKQLGYDGIKYGDIMVQGL